jgi:hypothetical protein
MSAQLGKHSGAVFGNMGSVLITLLSSSRSLMLEQQKLIASMSPSRDTLVVCFDAETMDLTTNSTITQLCHSIKNADRTLVYYAVHASVHIVLLWL